MLPYICDDLNVSTQLLHRVVSFIKSVFTSQNLMTNMCYNIIMIGSSVTFVVLCTFGAK